MKQKNNRNIDVIRRNFGKATRVLALIALGSLVLYFVRDSVNKFYSRKTATTIDILPLPEVKFPYVSLCPGFKEEELKKMQEKEGILVTYFDAHEVGMYRLLCCQADSSLTPPSDTASSEEIMSWWNSLVIDLPDFINNVTLESGKWRIFDPQEITTDDWTASK